MCGKKVIEVVEKTRIRDIRTMHKAPVVINEAGRGVKIVVGCEWVRGGSCILLLDTLSPKTSGTLKRNNKGKINSIY